MNDLSWAEAPKSEFTPTDLAQLNLIDAPESTAKQGSKAWLEWRGKGLGSSDAAVLLGWSPWKKLKELWSEKLGIWKQDFGPHQRAAMARGTALEPVIRKWYEHQIGALFPDGIATDPTAEYRRVSFDGINREIPNEDGSTGSILEIKAPNMKDHEIAKMGGLPEKYLAQVQWQMMIADMPWCSYVSYGSDGTYATVRVKADADIQRELRERSDLFWKHVQTKVEPEEWPKFERRLGAPIDLSKVEVKPEKPKVETAPAAVQIAEGEVEGIVTAALIAQVEANAAEARFEALKEKLKQILGREEKMTKGEAVFGWQARKGAVNYSVIPELIGLDLDQFRKADTKAFYFKRVDAK